MEATILRANYQCPWQEPRVLLLCYYDGFSLMAAMVCMV